jgi:flagellar hook-associated protein 3 FlgL
MDDALADAVTDIDGNAQLGFPESTLTYAASSGSGSGNVTQGGAIFIKETGELIMSDALAQDIRSSQATLNIEYTKTGFDSGEAKPEYYFNCTKTTADGKTVNYTKYDENGNEIDQDINYLVASSQSLTVNTEASDILTTDIARDVDEMIEAMTRSLEAIQKVDDITEMQGLSTYSSSGAQDALATWLAAAEKERDYANANLQQLYNKYIGNFDSYVEKVNLAITDVGSKGVSLSLTKNRVSNQLSTVKELQSNNEDRDLSDIILDYTSAYTAYEASLQAAATLNQTTLLNYL